MKKIFSLFAIAFIFFNCSKNSDDTDSQLEDFTVTITVDPNYNFSEFHISTMVFLSDENGAIMDNKELIVGETITLSFSGEPSMRYDLSYMHYADIHIVDEKSYTLTTFTNIDSGEYTIGSNVFPENTFNEIYLNLDNIGYPSEVTSGTSGAGTFGPENGGYYNYKGNLVGSPTSNFYISFKSPNDQFDRYFFGEDISEGSVFNIDYTALPLIQNTVEVTVSPYTIYNFQLKGLNNEDVNKIHHSIRQGNYPSGQSAISIPVPDNVFDSYLFNITYGHSGFLFFKNLHTANIPNSIASSSLGFTVMNPAAENFIMDTFGNPIIYDVIFRGANSNENVYFAHQIYGEAVQNVSFSKENLRHNIQDTYSDITGFETLPLGSVSLMRYSTINSYKDVLEYKIQGKNYEIPEGEFYEGVSKQFD